MTHPLEQLAPYVDGSLDRRERGEIERHLASCSRCRTEVAAASEARSALRSLAEVPVPSDLGEPAQEAMRREGQDAGPPRWVRAMPLVAAAAIVALLAITLPRIGGLDADSSGPNPEAAAPATAPQDLRVEVVQTDFDADSLQAEAQAVADRSLNDAASADPQGVESSTGSPAPTVLGPARSADAARCLRTAFAGFPGEPTRLVQASFEGTPAYLAFVLEGPGAGQPADQLTVWVADRRDCSIVSLTAVTI